MKQISADKHTIAWFKLAECVSRGEKERALGVYRLLSHSLDDQAFAQQLEADLLLSFKEKNLALKKYTDAAFMYEKAGRLVQATAVFEHLLTLHPTDISYRERLIELYATQKIEAKKIEHQLGLITTLIELHEIKKARTLLEVIDVGQQSSQILHTWQMLIFAEIEDEDTFNKIINQHIESIIEWCIEYDEVKIMREFLAQLKVRDKTLYECAQKICQE